MPQHADASPWIRSPLADLFLISFSWLPIYAVFAFGALTAAGFACDVTAVNLCPESFKFLIVPVLFANRLHRHYSLAFAYGDGENFARYRSLYAWAPVLAVLAVAPGLASKALPAGALRSVLASAYVALSSAVVVWQTYHTIMQKYGFLRIYSAKAGHGDPRVEWHLLWSWTALATAALAYHYVPELDDAARTIGLGPRELSFLLNHENALQTIAGVAVLPALLYACVVTAMWVSGEIRKYTPRSVPKLAFAISTAALYATFAHSLLVGLLAFAFSHALEYSAFVNFYARRKYGAVEKRAPLLRLWSRHWLLANVALVGGVYLLTLALTGLYASYWGLLIAYGNVTAMLHFVFDGHLWKVRDPATRAVMLDL